MKWPTATSLTCLAACWGVTRADTLTCHTSYGATSTSQVPTRTSTKTITISVVYHTNVAVTSTESYTTSYISVVGETTVTVPTGASYTPLTDAPINVVTRPPLPNNNVVSTKKSSTSSVRTSSSLSSKKPFTSSKKSSSTSSFRKSSALSSSKKAPVTSYPESVDCTTTQTNYHTTTETGYVYVTTTTWVDGTITTHVPTSTAYEACEDPDNVLTLYHGQTMEGAGPSGSSGPVNNTCSGGTGPESGLDTPEYAGIACLNARTCCEGAQRYGYNGWIWGDLSGVHGCSWTGGAWSFTTAYPVLSNNNTWGNGPDGPGGTYQDVIFSH